jgi:CRISPR-associated endoribonuclease Cas6
MRLKITFNANKAIVCDMNYHQQIQGFIYSVLDDADMRCFLHEHGFVYGKRKFKLFVFSRLMGKSIYDKGTRQITFFPPVQLFLSSPWTELLQSLVNGIMNQTNLMLGANYLKIEEVSLEPTPSFKQQKDYQVKMLSPVTIYSTLLTQKGAKKTYYYAPGEQEFGQLIRQNLIKKAKAYYNEDWSQLPFNIKSVGSVCASQRKIIFFKNTVIKGWMGRFSLAGDPHMLRLAYDAGIGGKNAQGFGMFSLTT